MVPQIDILRCANMLLRNYGRQDATYRASCRADACLDQGDIDGQQLWKKIIAAIREIASMERNPADLVH
jgi:hypothetical protein